MSYYQPAPKKSKAKGWIGVAIVITAGILGLAILACAGLLGGLSTTPQGTTGAPVILPSKSPNPPQSAAKTTKRPSASIGPGDWLVGTDMDAGTYKTPGTQEGILEFCVWTVYKSDDPGSEVVDFGTSGERDESGRVKLKNGQLFETDGCQPWVKQ